MSGELTRRVIDELMEACDKIHDEYDKCSDCPMAGNCLLYDSIEDIWNEVSSSTIDEFIDFADALDEGWTYEDEIAELNRGYDRDRL